MKKIAVGLLLLLPFCTVIAQTNFKALDSLLEQYNIPGTPGVSMRIVKNGKIIYNRQAGYENIQDNKHLSDESVFHLASVSKQFTASCIVLLEQQGKLRLDNKLSKYFPDFPEYAQRVTIKDLLNHTAGVKDIVVLAFIKGEKAEDYNNEQIKSLLAIQELDFEPGTKHSYSNSGYWFLAQIVEKVSGKPVGNFARANIFKPLKMKNTAYYAVGDKIKNRALGYCKEKESYIQTNVDAKTVMGAGVDSTLDDLQLWLQEMQDKKVLGEAFWKRMLDEEVYNEEGFAYSKGLVIYADSGHKEISHGGDNDGFHTYTALYPNDKMSIITLSNNDAVSAELLNTIAANTVFGLSNKDYIEAYNGENEMTIPKPDSLLSQYEGLYNDNGYYFLVKHENGILGVIQVYNDFGYEIVPVNDNTFTKANFNFIFEDIVAGKAQKMIIDSDGSKDTAIRKVIAPGEISKCFGTFYCNSLDVDYVFYEEDGRLKCKIGQEVTEADYAGYKIMLDRGGLKLDLAEDGLVKGFTLNHPRVKNIKFVKKL